MDRPDGTADEAGRGRSDTVPRTERVLRTGRALVRRALLPIWPREGETWDHEAGVRTEDVAELDELTVEAGSAAEGHPYVPTPPRLVRSWMDLLPDEHLPASTFVDMGSGRGRVLLMASERPFAHVVGVEFTRELHEAAEENIRRFPPDRRRCVDVRSILDDAGEFVVPDGPLVLYFDNPFGEPVMRRVLENLRRSHAERPRPIVAVYQQVRHESSGTATDNVGLLDRSGFLTGRTLRFALRDRLHLRSFLVRIYTSPEAAHLDPYPSSLRGSA